MSSKFNEIVPYYGMDKYTAKSFAPIDEYIGLTRRFSEKGMKKNNIKGAVLWGIGTLAALAFAAVCFSKIPECVKAEGISEAIPMILAGLFLLLMTAVIFGFAKGSLTRKLDSVPPDVECARFAIDKEGMEEVHQDFISAVEFTKKSVIGKKYIFIKNETIIRLKDIYHVCLYAPVEESAFDSSNSTNDFYLKLSVTTDNEDYTFKLPIKALPKDYDKYRHKQQEFEQIIRQKTEKIDTAHDRNRRENARKRMTSDGRETLKLIQRSDQHRRNYI